MPGRSTRGHDHARLTEPEIEVMKLCVDGSTNREIAEALQISVEDVERRLQGVFEKLGVHRGPEPPVRSA